MDAIDLDEDGDLLRLERRLTPSPGQRARLAALRAAWRIERRLDGWARRTLDLVVATTALVVLLPVMLVAAGLIKATDGGPVLFWQTRVGKWGRTFRFPKFRSMVVDAEALQAQLARANQHGDAVTFKIRRDPRITWIGRILRRTSVDELPQLWCVLSGEMSLVGPRPALVHEVARYTLDDRRRLEAAPGLTCTWQVSGRSDIAFPEQLRLDVEYIEQQSLRKDLELLARTVPAVLTGRGAY